MNSRLGLVAVGLCLAGAGIWEAPALAAPSSSPSISVESSAVPLNRLWLLMAGFLVFFMQAGFALVESGMTRAKNVVHTMAMNVTVYCLATFGFWAFGFALMFGNAGNVSQLGPAAALDQEFSLVIGGKSFGLFGQRGFFLAGLSQETGVLALFLFQVMFLDTAATIPTGALAERWRFLSFLIFTLFMSIVIYPIYGNWVWGNGWLAQLGSNFGLGHGHVDFAGSSVVHMVGGIAALVGAWVLGPRIGKFRPDGTASPILAHNVPMYMLGTLILAFGWFGFNTGSIPFASDPIVARVAVNTVLASTAGSLAALAYMWLRFGKPDPSFLCNGILAGLVAITASCAYVEPWAAALIGATAGLLVIWSCLFIERVLGIDDPVGAISVHGVNGAWGAIALGLFADGSYAPRENFNGVAGNVTGLLYGSGGQLLAQLIGVLATVLWVAPTTYAILLIIARYIGNRVTAATEVQGLDIGELGALGYTDSDPKTPEARAILRPIPEPRPATIPGNSGRRFRVVVDGVDAGVLNRVWSDLCQVGDRPPPPELLAIYPYVTTIKDNRFRFRGGDPQQIRASLERLLREQLANPAVRARLESMD